MNISLLTTMALALGLCATAQDDQRAASGDSGVAGDPTEVASEEAAGPRVVGPRVGLERYAAPMLSFRPSRIPPGGTGVAHLLVIMQRSAVMLPGAANVELSYEPQQGVLSFGDFTVLPAKPGKLATPYKGQPVWEELMRIEIPVAVASDAKFGEAEARFQITADVHSATQNVSLGRYTGESSGTANIGPPLPVVNVPARAARDETRDEPARIDAPESSGGSGGTVAAETAPRVLDGGGLESAGPVVQGDTEPVDYGVRGSEDSPMPLIVVGAAFALVVVLLVVGRKKA